MNGYLTLEPDNKDEHFDLERAASHFRDARSDPAIKYATNIAAESLKAGNLGRPNMLGTEW